MNEADTPNNEAFVEPLESSHSLQLEVASCPFYSVLSRETTGIPIPQLAPAQDKQCENEIPSDNPPREDWVAEPDREKQQMIDSEFQKLLALNEELRRANNDLYDQVEKLKIALTESEKAVEWQKKRSSVTESMLNQQAQELAAAQEQAKSLYQQLETATTSEKRQDSLIENYKTHQEINEQRLAQLERECTLIQSNYNEQSHQLVQAENACRELRTRLMRQQRQTLQFKAALEKCLETTVPSYDSFDDRDVDSQPSKHSQQASSLFTCTQPIRPWSVEQESFTDNFDNPWEESSASPIQKGNSASNQSSIWDTLDREEILESTPAVDDTPEIQAVGHTDSNNLEEHLDGVIQMFLVSSPASASSPPPMETDADSMTATTTIWETTATQMVDEPETANVLSDTETQKEKSEDDSQRSQSSSNRQLMNDSTNPNSPSPLLYPHRPPKGRKSFSSVELPNFRPSSQSNSELRT